MTPNSVQKPNFFILGAGKSGTTSLYNYLTQHPQVFMSPVKEPSFFCDIFQVISNPIDYISLFKNASHEKAIGEASHAYMSYPGTAGTLKAFFPNAKFIVIFRNPAERAYSLYKHMIYHGLEWIGTFEKALAMEEVRVKDPVFKKKCPRYFYNYLYFRSGLYGEQLERYLEYYDKKNFLFLLFDELKDNHVKVISKVYEFLGVDQDFIPEAKIHNQKPFDIRFPRLNYILTTKLKPLEKINNALYKKIKKISFRLNISEKAVMKENTKNNLLNKYEHDMKKLEKICGMDIINLWVTNNAAEKTHERDTKE